MCGGLFFFFSINRLLQAIGPKTEKGRFFISLLRILLFSLAVAQKEDLPCFYFGRRRPFGWIGPKSFAINSLISNFSFILIVFL